MSDLINDLRKELSELQKHLSAHQKQLAEVTRQRDSEREARKALQHAADAFAADQTGAAHPSFGLVQPVSVADCEALNAALALAAKLP